MKVAFHTGGPEHQRPCILREQPHIAREEMPKHPHEQTTKKPKCVLPTLFPRQHAST
jgi:hypothetical protein